MIILLQTIGIFFIVQVFGNALNAQPCNLTAELESTLPPFMDYIDGPQRTRSIRQHYQVIIPGYRFNCSQTCGYITEWGVNVRYADLYALDLQVWRPSPTFNASTDADCYSLVGNNRFTTITPSHHVIVVTPSPQDYIQFQPGDVLGFYVEEAPDPGQQQGVVYLTDSYRTSTRVWLASIDPMEAFNTTSYCPDTQYKAWRLRRAAPVISISIETYSCRAQSTTTVCPTATNIQPSSTSQTVTYTASGQIHTTTTNAPINNIQPSTPSPTGYHQTWPHASSNKSYEFL